MFKYILSILLMSISLGSFSHNIYAKAPIEWRLNTSNKHKLADFKHFFSKHNIKLLTSQHDLDEIDADPISVVAHKASQVAECTLIDDTSLDVEGAAIGVNVRWMLDHLKHYIGQKAYWRVLLAYRYGDHIIIYKGEVEGTIVAPQGKSVHGFDAVFLPTGSSNTLAEGVSEEFNARALAVKEMINGHIYIVTSPIYDWEGAWQAL